MKLGSLFSGYCDGFGLAAQWADIKVAWQVEINRKAHLYLIKNFNETEKFYDIKEVGKHNLSPVDIIVGGDPCQPHSNAGNRKGIKDDRYLWPEMLRVCKELRPTWIINENVIGSISNMVLDQKSTDLENEGYTTQPFIIPAVSVDAPHRRDRVWLVAYNDQNRQYYAEQISEEGCDIDKIDHAIFESQVIPHAYQTDSEKQRIRISNEKKYATTGLHRRWEVEPEVGRVVDGFPNRVAQLEGLGDSIVPQIPFIILSFIKEIQTQ